MKKINYIKILKIVLILPAVMESMKKLWDAITKSKEPIKYNHGKPIK